MNRGGGIDRLGDSLSCMYVKSKGMEPWRTIDLVAIPLWPQYHVTTERGPTKEKQSLKDDATWINISNYEEWFLSLIRTATKGQEWRGSQAKGGALGLRERNVAKEGLMCRVLVLCIGY